MQVGSSGLLLMVADGMGGHNAGEVASHMAVEAVSQRLCRRWNRGISRRQTFVLALQEAILRANACIHQASQEDNTRRGMGTTLTAAGVYDGAVCFAQVGDSRGYLIRANVMTPMTRDQSLEAKLEVESEAAGVRVTKPLMQHVLVQALGPEPQVTVPVSFAELRRGDWVLLCSDGLTNMVSEKEIADIVSKTAEPRAVCQALIAVANENGGRDNVTVVTARCNGLGLPLPNPEENPSMQDFVTRPWWQRLVLWGHKGHGQ
ncbi:MAG: serine/threonine-protein phosphatase [Deltaproteobacteria bacterium]|nr:serine/threonine-protein phosphatase [Deltaproteobacteria bacterium]